MDGINYEDVVELVFPGGRLTMTLADAVMEVMSWQRAEHRRAASIVRDGELTLQYLEVEAIYDRPDFPDRLFGS